MSEGPVQEYGERRLFLDWPQGSPAPPGGIAPLLSAWVRSRGRSLRGGSLRPRHLLDLFPGVFPVPDLLCGTRRAHQGASGRSSQQGGDPRVDPGVVREIGFPGGFRVHSRNGRKGGSPLLPPAAPSRLGDRGDGGKAVHPRTDHLGVTAEARVRRRGEGSRRRGRGCEGLAGAERVCPGDGLHFGDLRRGKRRGKDPCHGCRGRPWNRGKYPVSGGDPVHARRDGAVSRRGSGEAVRLPAVGKGALPIEERVQTGGVPHRAP